MHNTTELNTYVPLPLDNRLQLQLQHSNSTVFILLLLLRFQFDFLFRFEINLQNKLLFSSPNEISRPKFFDFFNTSFVFQGFSIPYNRTSVLSCCYVAIFIIIYHILFLFYCSCFYNPFCPCSIWCCFCCHCRFASHSCRSLQRYTYCCSSSYK